MFRVIPSVIIHCSFVLLFCLNGGIHAEVVVTMIPANQDQPQDMQGRGLSWNSQQIQLVNAANVESVIPIETVRRVRFSGSDTSSANAIKPTITIELTNGDFLLANSLSLHDEIVQIELSSSESTLPPFQIGIEFVREVRFADGAMIEVEDLANDAVLLKNGDVLLGQLNSMTQTAVVIHTKLGELTIEIPKVSAIRLNPLLADVVKRPVTHAVLYDRFGGALTIQDLQTEMTVENSGTLFKCKPLLGEPFRLPLKNIQRVDLYNDRFVSLTDCPLISSVHKTAFGTTFNPKQNRSFRGKWLQSNGESHRYGWGVSSGSTLELAIPEGFTQFSSAVGLEQQQPFSGHVTVSILNGDEVIYETSLSQFAKEGTGFLPLKEHRPLKLKVDFGLHADINDLTNWYDPVLIKK